MKLKDDHELRVGGDLEDGDKRLSEGAILQV